MKLPNPISLCIALISMLICTSAFAQRFYFPFNAPYENGVIYTNTQTANTINMQESNLYRSFYEMTVIDSDTLARIPSELENDSLTTSESIANLMFTSVYLNFEDYSDSHNDFNYFWNYYKQNMNEHGLMYSQVYGFSGQPYTPADRVSNTAADITAALALIQASVQWSDIRYMEEAQTLISNIWEYEIDHNSLLVMPNDSITDYIKLSVIKPAAFEIFSLVDTNNWQAVIDAGYDLLQNVQNEQTGLIPEWCYANGDLIDGFIENKYHSYYFFDANRIPGNMSLAYAWFGHEQAKAINTKIADWIDTAANRNVNNEIRNGYFLNGQIFNNPDQLILPNNDGVYSVASFTLAIGLSAMINNSSNYEEILYNSWQNGAYSDPYSTPYYRTAQWVDQHIISGNAPNFIHMVPFMQNISAEEFTNIITISFNIPVNRESAIASLNNFTITSQDSDTASASTQTFTIDSCYIDTTNPSQLVLYVDQLISAPFINVEYTDGTIISTDSISMDNHDKQTWLMPCRCTIYPVNRYISVEGNVIISWSDTIDASTINIDDFTVRDNWTEVSIATIFVDENDPTDLIIELTEPFEFTHQYITVSYTGGTLYSEGGTIPADAFDDTPVQFAYSENHEEDTTSNTATAIQNHPDDISLKVYPNPTVDNITICAYETITKVTIYNNSGNIIKIRNCNNTEVTVNTCSLLSGNYILEINTETEITRQQFIKK